MSFPTTRLRRNRQSQWSRNLVSENELSVSDLIWPVFVQEGENKKTEIPSMPDVFRLSIDLLIPEIKKAKELGICAVAIFPVVPIEKKTELAEEAFNSQNLICCTVREIKKEVPEIGIICDVALDPYTSHGQDGLIINDYVDNDETLKVLIKQSIQQAKAGCDVIAPSDMMDGRIGAIRESLDAEGFQNIQILSYSAKYASAFYGPFRDAVGSSGNLGKGSKSTYQMDPRNGDEAIREIELDIKEGADMVMIKPGMPYLDIIKNASSNFKIPILAYQVSGEYSMICGAAQNGWIDKEKAMLESLTAFKRAGCCGILTYSSIWIAEILNKK